MTRRKTYEFEVIRDAETVFKMTVPTKALKFDGMRDCMRHIDGLGGSAVIRCRSVTARDWAHWAYTAGASHAHSVRPISPCAAENPSNSPA